MDRRGKCVYVDRARSVKNDLVRKKGFTIVELLIVIVVIGILAAITIVAYNGIQTRARDASRVSAVGVLKKGLALYAADNNDQYPAACSAGDNQGCSVNDLSSFLVPKYIASIPQDPQYPTKLFSYVRGPVANSSYAIFMSGNESRAACKTGSNVDAAWWSTSILAC